jgi:hypothetical protein
MRFESEQLDVSKTKPDVMKRRQGARQCDGKAIASDERRKTERKWNAREAAAGTAQMQMAHCRGATSGCLKDATEGVDAREEGKLAVGQKGNVGRSDELVVV